MSEPTPFLSAEDREKLRQAGITETTMLYTATDVEAAFNAGARQQREAAEELLATLPRFHDGHVTPRIELDVALVAIRTQPLVEWKP